jgi:hypothetical protein
MSMTACLPALPDGLGGVIRRRRREMVNCNGIGIHKVTQPWFGGITIFGILINT